MSLRADNYPLAIGAMLALTFALSFGDAVLKGISAEMTLWQIFALRSALVLPLFLVLIRFWPGGASLMPRRTGWVALRSVLLLANWLAYYAALPHLELPAAAAAYYTLPLFITLFAALLGGERVALAGWVAVAVGFLGVALILRPGAEGVDLWVLMPVLAAVFYALAMVVTRSACREEDPLALAVGLHVAFVLAGLVGLAAMPAGEGFLGGGWRALAMDEAMALAVLCIAILIGSIGTAVAYQNAPSSVIGCFDFAYVGFAVLWGVTFFRQVPDAPTAIGIAMIVGAGILAVRSGTRCMAEKR